MLATETGSVLERISADGDLHPQIAREVLTHDGSAITFTDEASLTGPYWRSEITSVGTGAGMFTFDLTLIWH
ncbi:MAG: hypothetical protein E6I28_12380 [Chloroflexi bacterium]|nr:MAG: hypothetical protein E6I28_12380 [Chloroflexota bacterium]